MLIVNPHLVEGIQVISLSVYNNIINVSKHIFKNLLSILEKSIETIFINWPEQEDKASSSIHKGRGSNLCVYC